MQLNPYGMNKFPEIDSLPLETKALFVGMALISLSGPEFWEVFPSVATNIR